MDIVFSNFEIQRITERQNQVVITDRMWARLLSSTNQPSFLNIKEAKKGEKPPTQLLNGESSRVKQQSGKQVDSDIKMDSCKDDKQPENQADKIKS